ncbi:hypothetical protein HRG_013644 [Hirsutella rhossiliensis]
MADVTNNTNRYGLKLLEINGITALGSIFLSAGLATMTMTTHLTRRKSPKTMKTPGALQLPEPLPEKEAPVPSQQPSGP